MARHADDGVCPPAAHRGRPCARLEEVDAAADRLHPATYRYPETRCGVCSVGGYNTREGHRLRNKEEGEIFQDEFAEEDGNHQITRRTKISN